MFRFFIASRLASGRDLFFEIACSHRNREKTLVTKRNYVTFTGEPIKIQIHWRVAESHEDTYSRVIVSIVDITGQKQAEAALRKERLPLESIIEGAQVGTWEWNLHIGETVFNETWAKIVGYTLDELSPVSMRTWEKLTHPDDLKQVEKIIERHIAGELPLYDIEIRMRHKMEHWVWMQGKKPCKAQTPERFLTNHSIN